MSQTLAFYVNKQRNWAQRMMSSSNHVYYGTIEEKVLMGYSQGLENLLSNCMKTK